MTLTLVMVDWHHQSDPKRSIVGIRVNIFQIELIVEIY